MLCKLARRRAVSSARDEVVVEDDTVETSPPSLMEVSPSISGARSPATRSRSNKDKVGKMRLLATGAAVEGAAEVARDGEGSSAAAWLAGASLEVGPVAPPTAGRLDTTVKRSGPAGDIKAGVVGLLPRFSADSLSNCARVTNDRGLAGTGAMVRSGRL